MAELLNFIFVFVGAILVLIALGLIGGFSPSLYVAQVAVASKGKKTIPYSIAIMAGVLLAIIVLIVLFQTFRLDTLLDIIDTAVHAITVSVAFNALIGSALIYGGYRYLHSREIAKPKPKNIKAKKLGGIAGIFGFGFARTFVSLTGVTATFVAGNVIGDVSATILEHLLYTVIFLVATIIPFAAIVIIMRRNPTRLVSLTDTMRNWLRRFNYHLIVGVGAIIFGTSIIIFNVMMALFY